MTAYERLTDAPPISRRTAIMQAGLAAAALAGLSGCTNYGASQTPSSAPSGAAGPLSAKAAEIPVGGGKIFADAQAVITQPTAGQFKAFTSICTHAQCQVNDVTDTINCNCHGSKFSISDGSVVNPPATAALAAKTVTVDGETLTIS
ncbi:MAG TPA: Rieske (2Fe-2S) protein [Propionibacteriaceae bacterium]|nr:Rieske (2Fe-2S) protein [Propionibacteriaceae bacterium]